MTCALHINILCNTMVKVKCNFYQKIKLFLVGNKFCASVFKFKNMVSGYIIEMCRSKKKKIAMKKLQCPKCK